MVQQKIKNQNYNKKIFYIKILIWLSIFLFFFIFLFGEIFYFYSLKDINKTKAIDKESFLKANITKSNSKNQILEIQDYNNEDKKPLDYSLLNLKARAIVISDLNNGHIFYQKNIYKKMPIASLSKLMTALVVLENFDLDKIVKISKEAISVEGDTLDFAENELISIRSLLYAMLISSSNTAATAIAENIPDKFVLKVFGFLSNKSEIRRVQKAKTFVALMNKKAQQLNLNSTYFYDSTGLSFKTYSNLYDLINLSRYILKHYPIIFEITRIPEKEIYSIDGTKIHRLVNINKLLNEKNINKVIIGGKTGYTDEAGECLLILIEKKIAKEKKIFISIILNSPDRFGEMQKIIDWVIKI